MGAMMMNFSANFLGLDNAATPLGLKAMEKLQEINPGKETISRSQIMFLLLNTAGLTLIPISIMTFRAANGAANSTDIFIPTFISPFKKNKKISGSDHRLKMLKLAIKGIPYFEFSE